MDADVADRLQRVMRRSGKSLKGVVNEALRTGLGLTEKPVEPSQFRIRAFVDGLQPGIDPEKMNQLADAAVPLVFEYFFTAPVFVSVTWTV